MGKSISNEEGTVWTEPRTTLIAFEKLYWGRYQRQIKPAKVKQMIAQFDARLFTPILVVRRADGRFAVIDGGHRAFMLHGKGVNHIPAYVLDAEPEEEASLFSKANARILTTPITPTQTVWAKACAGEPAAVAVYDMYDKTGIPSGTAASTLYSAASEYGGDVVAKTGEIIMESGLPHDNRKAWVFKGVATILGRLALDEDQEDRLALVLGAKFTRINNQYRDGAPLVTSGPHTSPMRAANAIIDAFNLRLRGGGLPHL